MGFMNISADALALLLWLYEITSTTIRVASLLTIPLYHTPSVSTAWLLVILLWPWPGILVYAVLGSRMLPLGRLKKHRSMVAHLLSVRKRIKQLNAPGVTRPEMPENMAATVQLAKRLGTMGITGGNACRYIHHSEQFFERMVELIDEAEFEVNMLYYIFSDGGPGRAVVDALKRAVVRGVTCRLLVDGVGSGEFLRSGGLKRMKELGIEAHEALPVQLFRRKAGRFDLRNHRKLTIVDRRYAVTGSHNIIDPNYGRTNLLWLDLSLFIEGPVVRQLECIFIEDWYVETGELLDTEHLFQPTEEDNPGQWCIQTVPSGPSYDTQNYQMLITAAIIGARKQVTITSPYLIPSTGLMEAMAIAVMQGVTVRLIVPARSDQFIAGNAAKAYYAELLEAGVEIYRYYGGLLHSKTVTIDDNLAFVGSSNFDIRSFALNFEINLVLYGSRETASLRRIQQHYLGQTKRLDASRWRQRNVAARAIESLTKLLSPLL